jgi:hypothetical protein
MNKGRHKELTNIGSLPEGKGLSANQNRTDRLPVTPLYAIADKRPKIKIPKSGSRASKGICSIAYLTEKLIVNLNPPFFPSLGEGKGPQRAMLRLFIYMNTRQSIHNKIKN